MKLSQCVQKCKTTIHYLFFGVGLFVAFLWCTYLLLTTKTPHMIKLEQSKPVVADYVKKYGARNHFLCDSGIYVEERIDDYGNITRQVMVNEDWTVESVMRCSDNVSIKTTEIIGGEL